MKVYFSRLWPSMKVIAFWFLVAAAIRIAFRLYAGTVSGGTPANIVIKNSSGFGGANVALVFKRVA